MKTNKALFGVILLGGILLSGCKKGENDPFLSLRSRKARICGEFNVTSYESVYKDPSTNQSRTEILNNGVMTITETDQNGTYTESFPYSAEYAFYKDGTFMTSVKSDAYSMLIKGAWFFVGKNKDADLKNKEAIGMVDKEAQYDNPGNSFVYNSKFDDFGSLYILNQLKEKEIILQKKGEYDDGANYNLIITLSKK